MNGSKEGVVAMTTSTKGNGHRDSNPTQYHWALSPPAPTQRHTRSDHDDHKVTVHYKDCLKNHAAAIGGNATDGCGEFIHEGEEGTMEALQCSACGCHRNFHRKETTPLGPEKGGPLVGPLGPNPLENPSNRRPTTTNSESSSGKEAKKRRTRTKFTAEQKERMVAFAVEVGWRMKRVENGVVERFCKEIGIKRTVLKVWMHNNKRRFVQKLNPSSFISSK